MGIAVIDGEDTGFLSLRQTDLVAARTSEAQGIATEAEPPSDQLQAAGIKVGLMERLDTVIADGSGLAMGLVDVGSTPAFSAWSLSETAAVGLEENPVAIAGGGAVAIVLGIALGERAILTTDAPVGSGQEGLPVGLGETAVAGVIEDWNVPDDATSVTGHLPWTRLSGTLLTVQGGRARLAGTTDADGLQIARCDVDIGTSDYELRGTLVLQPADAGLAVTALLARVTAANTFYQARAVRWAANFVDLWKNVAGSWERIGGPAAVTPQDGDQLRFHLSGSTLTVYLQGALVIGPLADTAIAAGPEAGIFAQWSGGQQAVIGMDDWMAIPLPFAGTPLSQVDGLPLRLGERSALAITRFVGDAPSIGISEWPVPTFFFIPAVESVVVDLRELGAAFGRTDQAEALGMGLVDAGVVPQPVDAVALDLQEQIRLLAPRAGADGLAVGLVDPQTVLEEFLILLRPAGTDRCSVRVVEIGGLVQQGFIQIRSESIGVAGILGESIGVAGIVNEEVWVEVP